MDATLNGRARRPHLAETIGKLDKMIDDLATAIPGAVADSVREVLSAVWPEVIQAAITRATAELAAAMKALPTPLVTPTVIPTPTPSRPRFTRLRAWAAGLRDRIWNRLKSWSHALGSGVRRTTSILAGAVGMFGWLVRRSPRAVFAATLTGSALGVGAFHLGLEFAAVLAGLSAGLMTLGGLWMAPFFRFLTPDWEQS